MTVRIEALVSGATEICLDRPAKANALDAWTVDCLHEAIDQAYSDRPAAIVLRGAGRHFCGGFDLANVQSQSDADVVYRFCRLILLLEKLYTAPFATIALTQGVAAGAGADLAAACDHRIAVSGAELRFPGPEFGAVLGSRRLAWLIGHATATALLTGERKVDTAEAERLGLLTGVRNDLPSAEQTVDHIVASVSSIPGAQRSELLEAVRPPLDGEGIADLVRSLVGTPGVQQRLLTFRDQKQRAGADEPARR